MVLWQKNVSTSLYPFSVLFPQLCKHGIERTTTTGQDKHYWYVVALQIIVGLYVVFNCENEKHLMLIIMLSLSLQTRKSQACTAILCTLTTTQSVFFCTCLFYNTSTRQYMTTAELFFVRCGGMHIHALIHRTWQSLQLQVYQYQTYIILSTTENDFTGPNLLRHMLYQCCYYMY